MIYQRRVDHGLSVGYSHSLIAFEIGLGFLVFSNPYCKSSKTLIVA